MNAFISFDGPKGVGKTTLIQVVLQQLLSEGRPVVALVEKDLIPAAKSTLLSSLYAAMKQFPTAKTDKAIAAALRSGRQIITHEVLPTFSDKIVLLDRWYPSDAVFRKYLPWAETVAENIAEGVRMPDLTFAICCDPKISWQRATERARTLDSKVIRNYEDHVQATLSFEQAAHHFGWRILRSDASTPGELCDVVCAEVVKRIDR
jgi:thymidylate kinase